MGSTLTPSSSRRAVPLLLTFLTTVAMLFGMASVAPSASAADGDIDVYVTFEGYNLGQGYYVQPTKVTVPAGTTAAAVTEQVLADTGHEYRGPHMGEPTASGWYLSGIKGFDTGAVNVPAYVTAQPDFQLTSEDGDGFLSEFDYSNMSGWMYTVDNVMAPVGAGSYELEAGDVMRWQFTMHGYGCDTGVPSGCWGAEPYFTMADKSELIRTLAAPNAATASAAELAAAKDLGAAPNSTQVEVDAAVTDLRTADVNWAIVSTSSQGQFLTKLNQALRNQFGQTAGNYDYSVIKKLRVVGPLNAQDYADLRSPNYAGAGITDLDLSGVVDGTAQSMAGMVALREVSLPPVASFTTSNPFQGNTQLRHVVVAAETYSFGSTTTFNGITTLERITFLHPTKPAFNVGTFNGSNNADPDHRTVVASVPNKTRGDYDKSTFTSWFAEVTERATAADRSVLAEVLDEAAGITEASAVPFRWTLLQQASAEATQVNADPQASAAEVQGARLVLQTALTKIGFDGPGLSIKVTKGADLTLSWKNGTAQHYAEFVNYPVAKVLHFSDETHDLYVPTVPVAWTTQKVATASIKGETDKVVKIFNVASTTSEAQYTLNLQPLEGREETSLTIPGLSAGDPRNLYTNVNDTGVVKLAVGEHFDLDTFRTSQAQLDQVNNLFIEPDYTFDVSGDSVTTEQIGAEGRRQLRITAATPGTSVIKITYDPLHYLTANDNGSPGNTNWSFNGIEKQNTGLVVVQVGESATFDTGITVRNELDTFYFDKAVGSRLFTFTPAAGTTVRVHDPLNVKDWGTGWTTYEAGENGAFTVKLRGGRNVIELTNGGRVQHYVVRAKAIDVTVANASRPGEAFQTGDNATLTFKGIEGGIEKLGGIYNPAFMAGTKPKLTYSDATSNFTSNEGGQYTSVTTTYTVTYPYTGAEATLDGYLSIGGLGSEWPYHRQIPLEGKPANLNAVAIGPYQLGALPTIHVYDGVVSTQPAKAPLDTAALTAALAQADGLVEGSYTSASWALLVTAVAAGQAVLADADAEQDGLDAASAAITDAIGALVLKTAPQAPAAPAVTLSGKTVTVTWQAPADGGSEITGYTVELTPASGSTLTATANASATSVDFTDLTPGTWTARVVASNGVGDSEASSASASVAVAPDPVATTIAAKAVTTTYGTSAKLVVFVKASAGVPTGRVTAVAGNRSLTGTLANGKATLTLPGTALAPGKRTVKLSYSGVAQAFTSATGTATLTVTKATAKLVAKAPKQVKRGKSVKVTVKLTVPGLKPTGSVKLTFAGKSVTRKVNASGQVVVTLPVGKKVAPGGKHLVVTHVGNTYVKAATRSVKIKVAK